MAGHVLQEATVDERLSKGRAGYDLLRFRYKSHLLALRQTFVHRGLLQYVASHGIKMAGHVLQEATVDERLSKGQQMRFIPKAQKIICQRRAISERSWVFASDPCPVRVNFPSPVVPIFSVFIPKAQKIIASTMIL
jgi:hypothetical protein